MELDFLKPYQGTAVVKNVYQSEEDKQLAEKVFDQYTRDNVIETRAYTGKLDTWIRGK